MNSLWKNALSEYAIKLKRFYYNSQSKPIEGSGTHRFREQGPSGDQESISSLWLTISYFSYLRYAERSSEAHTAEILFKIADEEKAHLAALGRLMEEKV